MIELDNKAKIKQIDLKAFFGQQVTLQKVSSQQGGGYAGPCPICGGNDRFTTYPALGICLCRQCSPSAKWEDIISFTMRQHGTGFQETCKYLLKIAAGLPVVDTVEMEHQAKQEPSSEWRRAGEKVVNRCFEALWRPEGELGRKYLQERRLSKETSEYWDLGASTKWQVIDGLNVPPGIVIPEYFEGKLWNLKVRVNEKKFGSKYLSVSWQDNSRKESCGRPILFGDELLKRHPVCVFLEGEFDTMLLDQEAGDLVACVTLGSCSQGIDARVIPHLLQVRQIFLAYDTDGPGQNSAETMKRNSNRFKIVNVPWGKDVTEFNVAGGDLRQWVESFLDEHEPDSASVRDDIPELEPAELDRQAGDGEQLPMEAAPLSNEITIPLGKWNRRVLERDKIKVSKSSSSGILCQLI